ncbi:MAG: hypothetical protein P4L10_06165 [Acidobacteriaceae bacterium]|nr:hypothetical protein [Acidobacteriaceae bacterium]
MSVAKRIARVAPNGEIKTAGIACMAAAWMLAATPLLAQNGSTPAGAQQANSVQDARVGVSHPDSSIITATPYADDAPVVESIHEAASSTVPAATPSAAPDSTAKVSVAPVYGVQTVYESYSNAPAGSTTIASHKKEAAAFDPDANIVTEETAGRTERRALAEPTNADAASDLNAGIVTRVPSLPGEVPDGTLVKVKLHEDLSSLTTKAGTSFTGEVSEPVLRDGQVVVPAGSLLEGRVTFVHSGKRIGNAAAIHLEARTITLPDGSQYALRARVIDTDRWDDTKVDSEGTILRKDHGKATATTISVSTGGGMVAGAVLGGIPGALIGAGVGAGTSAVVWARQDRQANLPKNLCIVFSLTEPMRIAPLSAQLTQPADTSISRQ